MNFFEHQEKARRNTAFLVILFALAVILIICVIYVAVVVGVLLGQSFMLSANSPLLFSMTVFWNLEAFLWIAGIISLVIGIVSSYKVYDLRQRGGAAVAEMLGGKRIVSSENDPTLRKLLNVIEEMAIASGMPVPPVYLLNQDGINAFAAGFTPKDAIIAVTRGATELLDRDQLQGVMAHEFSHIFNGDMRLKFNLMGILSGITFISDAGMFLMTMPLHSVGRSYKRSNRNSNGSGLVIAMMVFGVFVFTAGLIGMVIADFIKLAVSRQREFLADAAAVQFTRNPEGIAGALKKIGGYKSAAYVRHAAANQASHMFFGNAIKSYFKQDWWASHPPLQERVRRIDPSFRGAFKHVNEQQRRQFTTDESIASFAVESSPQQFKINVDDVMAQIGNPDWNHLQQAKAMLAQIPTRLHDFAADPYTARAVVYALLLDVDVKQRKVQLQVLQKSANPNVFRETIEIQPLIEKLAVELRLPLINLVLPTLKQMSMAQYKRFKKNVGVLIKSDHQVSLFEYVMHRILLRHLHAVYVSAAPDKIRYHSLHALMNECACVVALLIRSGSHKDKKAVFMNSMKILDELQVPDMPAENLCRLLHFDAALKKLAQATPKVKEKLLTACVYTIFSDGKVVAREVEMIRAVADALDCPMPPVMVGLP